MFGRALSSNLGKVLGTLLVVGMAGSTVSYGTFASFTASTSNVGNTFSTGTLVLSNKLSTSASTCFSTGGSNTNTNANNCDIAFTYSGIKPGDAAKTADITLKNDGSLNASALKIYANAACANSSVGTYSGTGDLCAAVRLTIQEYDSSFTTAGTCHFGGASCALDSTKTLSTFPLVGSAIGAGGMNAGTFRYFRVTIDLPSTAGNDLQGRQAAFGFTWAIEQ